MPRKDKKNIDIRHDEEGKPHDFVYVTPFTADYGGDWEDEDEEDIEDEDF